MARTPTTDQIRDAIDSGKTGEKVGFPDPAAAPLGTDAEAGGHPPSRAERAMEATSAPSAKAKSSPPIGIEIYILIAAAIALVAAAIVFIAA